MDVRTFFRVVTSRWWLVIPVFLVTVGVAVVFALSRTPLYRTSVTYILKPALVIAGDDPLSALAIVSRQTEIASTYAQVADSRTIRSQAADAIGLSGGERRDMDVKARLTPGTNVLEITVLGPAPELVQGYATALGKATAGYVDQLYNVFQLALLDEAVLPDKPSEPNVPLTIGLGVLVALVLSGGAAFALELLSGPRRGPTPQLTDDVGFLTRAYLLIRLREEVGRTRRSGRPFAVALMDLDRGRVLSDVPADERHDVMRRMATLFHDVSVDETVARVGDHLLAILLPERNHGSAEERLAGLRSRARIGVRVLTGSIERERVLDPSFGLVVHRTGGVEPDELLDAAEADLWRRETGVELASAGAERGLEDSPTGAHQAGSLGDVKP